MQKRFFVETDLKLNNSYTLGREDYNYIVQVMRLKVGDQIVLNNNTAHDYLCKIVQIGKNTLDIEVLEQTKNMQEAKTHLTLCQALVKGEKLELIAQKITELGATELVPFVSKYTVVKAHTQKPERLQKITQQASSQCGRSKTLSILPITNLQNLVEKLKDFDLVLLAYEKALTPLKGAFSKTNLQKVAIIVGSEGGFDEAEVAFLQNNLSNLKTIGLGRRILRAETAAVVLTGLVMHELGELA